MDVINYVINTLSNVEVRGRDNMQMILGCIYALEEYQRQLTQTQIESGSKING